MSKKDDEINRQLIFNSGGANPEDYLTPKQLKRYKENPERFIDIDVDLAFTPGVDDDRTDTYEAQIKLQEDDQTAEEQFEEAQGGIQKAADFIYDAGVTLPLFIGSGFNTNAAGSAEALKRTIKGDKRIPSNIGINYGPNDGFGGWEPMIDEVLSTDNEETINELAKYSSGTVVQTEEGPLYRAGDIISNVFQMDKDPEPNLRKTPTKAERELRINRWVNDLAFTVDKVKRDGTIVPTHISKLQPKGSGYAFLAKAKAEWNQWAKRTGFIRELSDKTMTAYVEHLVGKDKYYDVFWNLPNEQRFRKGSRHGPNNVRILLDNRMKSFKDSSETILKQLLPKPNKNNLLVFDYDMKRNANESIVYNTSPQDLVLKRADGTVVGRLGDYHDVLYAPYKELKEKLSTHENPATGRPYITIALPSGQPLPKSDIQAQISMWRTAIIRDKIQFIIDEAPTLKGMTKKQKWQYQGSAIEDDMVNFLAKYHFLEPAKGFREDLKSDIINAMRGGTPIKTEEDRIREADERIFTSKTTDRKVMRGKYRRSFTSDDIDRILGRFRSEDEDD